MNRGFLGALVISLLAGCSGPVSLDVVDFKALTDERLTEYYHEVEADIVAARASWEEASLKGQPLRTEIRKNHYNDLMTRREGVALEIRLRGLGVPDSPKK